MTRLIGKLFALAKLSNSLSQSVSVFDIYNKPAQQRENTAVFKVGKRGRSQDGRGIGRGDHFLFYKFIERTTER